MTVIEDVHADHGAAFVERGGRRVVATYGRTERTHRAVRNGVGVVELGSGVVEVTGEDRVEFVDNAVSNRVPDEDGRGAYCLLLDPQGRIEADLYVYNAGERLLLFCPPDRAGPIADDWRGKTFIQDVSIRVATDDLAVFGVHGPSATEKIASVLNRAGAPEPALTFVRGSMGDAGVTVIAGDGLAGEEGYEVICAADAAAEVFDTLVNHGMNAVPFGYETWDSLTLEAGTPLYETELRGRVPNVAGVRNALDFEKGCYVGQEVVSRVENRGRPSKRLVGLACDAVPESGAAVLSDGSAVGEVTRGAEGPSHGGPIALAYVPFDFDGDPTVRIDGEERGARAVDLPFVEGSARSARLPTYPDG
ncbi:CAF17-like 4Fe-4S cluster assembly/insertion protein YgfZ [Halomarina pelagica]|uniref:CAF17-like 4Fe-4S cluster assembly/insertion protein YgfZ n=1 Tax=Halomarina pelagica TaxID=2961599 RepID=UPI0020C3CE15|nr:aminomethyltransferase family protein [Halomarina sp. BND7]